MPSGFARTTRRDILRAGTGLAGLLAMPHVARGQAADPVRFSLEFRIYGGNAPMFLAAEAGIFREQGISAAIDGSSGSGESITRIATGTHDFGTADVSTLVEFAARNPKEAPKLIMTVFDRFPAVVLSLKRKPINTLKQLEGARLGTGTSDAGSKILPALLARNKIDAKAINRVTIDVKLRETMLLKGEVDAIIAFDYTALFNLVEAGLKIDDVVLLYFSDFGFDFWGNSLIASPALIEKNPDLVRRLALAVARGWVASAKDRAAAINAVTKRDGLLKATTERARMDWMIDRLVLTPNVQKNGLGWMDSQRMERGLTVLKEGFQLTAAPTMDQIYDDRFLPPAADRKIA
jgi:NitT/TauT family transport system substrate-binding protein